MLTTAPNKKFSSAAYQILIADDHPILRSSIRLLLQQDVNYAVCGEASNGEELLEQLSRKRVDLIILDLNMPTLNGIQTLELLSRQHSQIAVIILTSHKERALMKTAFAKGARGYLLKEDTHDTLLAAIRDIREGRRAISPELASMMLDDYAADASEAAQPAPEHPLSSREKMILSLIANGLRTREIAQRLKTSPRTIDSVRARIREKINAATLADLVQYAVDHRLL